MRIVVPSPGPEQLPDGLWCYSIDRERSLLGGALTDGGSIASWLTKTLQIKREGMWETGENETHTMH